jgi:outer membrane protein, heavy metal efflux system
MNRFFAVVRSSVAYLLVAGPLVSAQDRMTLDAALERARAHAPAVVAGRVRVEEARARVRGASRPRDNPQLETAAGRRQEGKTWEIDIGLSQPLEIGGRRGARVAAAEAGLAREAAVAEDALRRALREVAGAYLTAASAQERLRVAQTAATFAEEILRIAQRRSEQGDVAALDVNLAQSGLARARADIHAIGATQAAALGTLRALLNLEAETPLTLDGTNGSKAQEIEVLMAAASQRADIQALEAEVREAEAEVRLGKSLAWPEVTPGVRYERDDGTNVLWGGLTVSLPVLNRGQEAREVAQARAQRVRGELAALRLAVRNEVQAGWTVYSLRQKAADELRAQLTALDDNDALARRSYEVGQIGLGELLLVRRETAEVRAALLERLAEAAEARIELETRAGVLR